MRTLLLITCLLVPGVLHAQVVPTNEWVSFWSDGSLLEFSPAPVGSVIRAYDPQGVVCGEFTVTTDGSYGLMPVYRDDVTTTGVDEGAEPGDLISFTIDDLVALPFGPGGTVWTSNGDIKRVNIAAAQVDLDIRPRNCPNVLDVDDSSDDSPGNTQSLSNEGGTLKVALLGTATFDVRDVDATSLRLAGVSPTRDPKPKDLSTPADNTACECVRTRRDGVLDLRLKFRRAEIVAAMGAFSNGEQRVLTLSGALRDGTPFQASDCVTIRAEDTEQPQQESSGTRRHQRPGTPVTAEGPRVESERAAEGLAIGQIYPNPFNPHTVITYSVPSTSRVKLVIYDVHGHLVRNLVDHQETTGEYSVTWRGVNESGSPVASGVYFVRLLSGAGAQTRKIILLK